MTISRVNLRTEADAEAGRLARARALLRPGDERVLLRLEADATWIAIVRRSGLRRSLGTDACLIWRVAFEDSSGRLVESRLVAVRVARRRGPVGLSSSRKRRAWIEPFLNHAGNLIGPHVQWACENWRVDVEHMTHAFWSTRRRRELAIGGLEPSDGRSAQAGLFDRRVERSRDAQRAAAAESERISAERLAAIASAAEIRPMQPRLMVAILP